MTEKTRVDRAADGERSGRDALLVAASELMIEMRTHDVSLHQIARRAGVTAPLVKYHFGSKDGLLVALAERDTARSLVQLEELMAMDVDAVAKMRIHIAGIIRTYSKYPYLNGLLDSLLRDDESDSARQLRARFVRPLIDAERRILDEGIAAGQFRPVDPKYIYFLIVGACQYIFNTRVAYEELMETRVVDEKASREYAAMVMDVVMRGLIAT